YRPISVIGIGELALTAATPNITPPPSNTPSMPPPSSAAPTFPVPPPHIVKAPCTLWTKAEEDWLRAWVAANTTNNGHTKWHKLYSEYSQSFQQTRTASALRWKYTRMKKARKISSNENARGNVVSLAEGSADPRIVLEYTRQQKRWVKGYGGKQLEEVGFEDRGYNHLEVENEEFENEELEYVGLEHVYSDDVGLEYCEEQRYRRLENRECENKMCNHAHQHERFEYNKLNDSDSDDEKLTDIESEYEYSSDVDSEDEELTRPLEPNKKECGNEKPGDERLVYDADSEDEAFCDASSESEDSTDVYSEDEEHGGAGVEDTEMINEESVDETFGDTVLENYGYRYQDQSEDEDSGGVELEDVGLSEINYDSDAKELYDTSEGENHGMSQWENTSAGQNLPEAFGHTCSEHTKDEITEATATQIFLEQELHYGNLLNEEWETGEFLINNSSSSSEGESRETSGNKTSQQTLVHQDPPEEELSGEELDEDILRCDDSRFRELYMKQWDEDERLRRLSRFVDGAQPRGDVGFVMGFVDALESEDWRVRGST
ncbi:hypothetical protein RUND412_009889, partial [Rhizina undulata]